MSKRDWSFGVALGLILGGTIAIISTVWIIGLNYCPEQPCNYDYNHSHGPTDGPKQHQSWIPDPRLPNWTLQFEPEFVEGNPKEYEYADLQAQENMARATNWIAWISFVSSLVALVGVWLLVSNLRVTREVGRDQTRAYVHAKEFSLNGFIGYGMMDADCVITIANTGSTPCRRFEISCGAEYIKSGVIPTSLPSTSYGPEGWSGLPGNDIYEPRIAIPVSGSEAIEDEWIIHFGGVIRYETFYGENFETEFSFMLKEKLWSVVRSGEARKLSRSTFKVRSYEQVK